MDGLPDHIEAFLGAIEAGWSQDADGRSVAFQVVRCSGGLAPGVPFVTLGLSHHALQSPASGRSIWQELLMVLRASDADGPAPGMLQQVGREHLASHQALLRGEVIGPRGPAVDGSVLDALYVAAPVCLPDAFAAHAEDNREVVFAWLVPIATSEAEYVRKEGWQAFEDRLLDAQPDLTDLHRAPVVL
jgi:hypothetical protein